MFRLSCILVWLFTVSAFALAQPIPGRLVEAVEDEPGTRLTWSLETIGRERVPTQLPADAFEDVPGAEQWSGPGVIGEGPGAVIARVKRSPEDVGQPGAIDDDWPEPTKIVRVTWSEQVGPLDRAPDGTTAILQRGWVACYEHPEPRGVAVLAPGMFGTPRYIIEEWTAALFDRGWTVVRLLAHSSRFTERVVFDLSDRRSARACAEEVAGVIDLRLWGCGYTLEAALRTVEMETPELRTLPRVAFGLSGGAIALPALVGWEPDRYRAMVMVAGGADFMSIASTSAYAPFIAAAQFRANGRKVGDERRAAVAELYRELSRFDPYGLAPRVEAVPKLLLHGEFDRAVPAAQGDLLWQRFGQPERWSFPVGHERLAVSLPSQFDRMLDWVDNAVNEADEDNANQEGRR